MFFKHRLFPLVVSGAILTASPLALADRSHMCSVRPDGKLAVTIDNERSLVEKSSDVLDASFTALSEVPTDGLTSNDSVFAFARTIGNIVKTAGIANTQPEREALLTSMLRTFREKTFTNPTSGLSMPVDERTGEAGLSPAELLDPAKGLIPVGLFNRLDQTPADFAYCGEQRIVYGLKSTTISGRFLLIFEALLPNPAGKNATLNQKKLACRRVAEMWAGLTPENIAINRARTLSKFFYDGQMDAGLKTKPVVHYENYGGDARGQVRGNLFINGVTWQLREWSVQVSPMSGAPEFVAETVKNNPLAQFYGDTINDPQVDAAAAEPERKRFQGEFLGIYLDNLMVEKAKDFNKVAQSVAQFENVQLTPDQIALTLIGLGSDNRYNEFQSISQGTSDDPQTLFANTRFKNLVGILAAGLQIGQPNSLTADHLAERAGASTCGGCHDFSNDRVVGKTSGGTDLKWPQSLRFVHNHEDRTLSKALTDVFLPTRAQLLRIQLCEDVPPEPAVAAIGPMSLRTIQLDAIGAKDLAETLQATPSLDRRFEIARSVQQKITDTREQDLKAPGAFITTRRPH